MGVENLYVPDFWLDDRIFENLGSPLSCFDPKDIKMIHDKFQKCVKQDVLTKMTYTARAGVEDFKRKCSEARMAIINEFDMKKRELEETTQALLADIQVKEEAMLSRYERQMSLITSMKAVESTLVANIDHNDIYRFLLEKMEPIHIPDVSYISSGSSTTSLGRLTIDEDRGKILPKYTFGGSGKGQGEFCRPWGICTAENGCIVVADRSNDRIQVFFESGDFFFEFGSRGQDPGQFVCPSGVATDNMRERIVVADKDNHRVQVFTMNGLFLFAFGGFGSEPGKFHYPWDVAVNNAGDILVSDSKNKRLQLFDKKGSLKKVYESCKLALPRGVTFRPDGKILVTDFNGHKVLILDENLNYVGTLGEEGDKPGLFRRPQGITCRKDGHFAVADCKNYRIQVFDPFGVPVSSFGVQGSDLGEFDCPQGLTYDSNGNLLVVDFGNSRVQIF